MADDTSPDDLIAIPLRRSDVEWWASTTGPWTGPAERVAAACRAEMDPGSKVYPEGGVIFAWEDGDLTTTFVEPGGSLNNPRPAAAAEGAPQ
jgi:hypothetical protein